MDRRSCVPDLEVKHPLVARGCVLKSARPDLCRMLTGSRPPTFHCVRVQTRMRSIEIDAPAPALPMSGTVDDRQGDSVSGRLLVRLRTDYTTPPVPRDGHRKSRCAVKAERSGLGDSTVAAIASSEPHADETEAQKAQGCRLRDPSQSDVRTVLVGYRHRIDIGRQEHRRQCRIVSVAVGTHGWGREKPASRVDVAGIGELQGADAGDTSGQPVGRPLKYGVTACGKVRDRDAPAYSGVRAPWSIEKGDQVHERLEIYPDRLRCGRRG